MRKSRKSIAAAITAVFLVNVILLGLTFVGAYADDAGYIANEDFNDTVAGDQLPSGWSLLPGQVKNPLEGSTTIVEKSKGDNCLKIFDNHTKPYGAVYSFAEQRTTFTVELEFKMDESAPNGATIIELTNLPTHQQPETASAVLVHFNKNSIRACNGTTTTILIKELDTTSSWIKMRIVVDPAEKIYSAYIGNEQIITDFAFVADISEISNIILRTAYSNMCTAYIDNVKIYTGGEEQISVGENAAKDEKTELSSETDLQAKVEKRLSNAIALFVGRANAFVNNKSVWIDAENPQVTPLIKEGRTLVPVRFISESLGAKVEWEEATSAVTISLANKTIKMTLGSSTYYINDQQNQLDVPAQTENGRTLIPLRALVEALGKEVFWHDRGLIVISDQNNIFSPDTEDLMIDKAIEMLEKSKEFNSFDSYSSVFLSSRWYSVGGGQKLGTLDVSKQFMATADKWSYIDDSQQITSIKDIGVGFQGALNTQINDDENCKIRLFDGTVAIIPQLITYESTAGCMNNPAFIQAVKDAIHKSIDAGADSFQHDDAAGNVLAYDWGGCFCEHCMKGFAEYLSNTYSKEQLDSLGVTNVSAFNYKNHIQTKYNASTVKEYLATRPNNPLEKPFLDYQYEVIQNYHKILHDDMESYAGKSIEYSCNSGPYFNNYYDKSKLYYKIHDIFDYFIGEYRDSNFLLEDVVNGGSFSTAIGKPAVISPRTKDVNAIKHGISYAYAMGQYFLVPWDIYLEGGAPRYFGTAEEYGNMFHFIRQYPFLFDGYEVPAKVGVLIKWDDINHNELKQTSMALFEAGIPFKHIVAGNENNPLKLKKVDFAGLSTVITHTPVSSFSKEDQQVITNSGVETLTPQGALQQLASTSLVSIQGDDELYAAVRAKSSEANSSKVIHLLSKKDMSIKDVGVTINQAEFFAGKDITAVLYRPGENPEKLSVSDAGNGKIQIHVPEIKMWGVILINPELSAENEHYSVPVPWSGINIGNPAKEGTALADGGSYKVSSKGMGLNVATPGDNGSSDQVSFVYQNINVTSLQSFGVSAKLESQSGNKNQTAGIMIRETPASNAKFLAVVFDAGKNLRLVWRNRDNAVTYSRPLEQVALPTYIKVEKQGANEFFVYKSSDGVNWGSSIGQQQIDFREILGGVFTASASNAESAESIFTDLDITHGQSALTSERVKEMNANISQTLIRTGRTANMTIMAVLEKDDKQIDITSEQIKYSVNNANVAKVDADGTVWALAQGEAMITAEVQTGGGVLKDTVAITVNDIITLVEENFENYDIGLFPKDEGARYRGNNTVEVVYDNSLNSKCLMLNSEDGGTTTRFIKEYDRYAEPIVVEMDFKVEFGPDRSKSGAMVCYLTNEKNESNISLLANPGGFWYLDNDDSITIAPAEDGKWYHIKLVANPITSKMDVFIDGEQKVEQGNFRIPTDHLKNITLGNSTSALETKIYWDNLRVTTY
ncbi:MAG: stalk domain-containing protein [Firmicutes bacterium]|nr:stalk domain-containing protein [Bacillota bacterium]